MCDFNWLWNLFNTSSNEVVDINDSKYQIIKELGRGGNSCVYEVQNQTTQELFALKRIIIGSVKEKNV